MFVLKLCAITFVFAFITVTYSGVVTEKCWECICEGTSNCNVTFGCTSDDDGSSYFCGPFYISRNYWIDAGSPVLDTDLSTNLGAFENCVLDLQCAAKTVEGYMNKFKQDCNGDGKLDCDDYMRIHGLGGYGCKERSFSGTPLYTRYNTCMHPTT